MTALNIAVLLLVIFVGSAHVETSHWIPFAPHGASAIMEGAGVIFFAYLGFDMVACLAEEVPHPETQVPMGIIGSLLISIGIYMGVSLVVTGYDYLFDEEDENETDDDLNDRNNENEEKEDHLVCL